MKVIVITFLLAVCLETVLTCRFGREYMDYLRQQALQRRSTGNYNKDDLPFPMNRDSAIPSGPLNVGNGNAIGSGVVNDAGSFGRRDGRSPSGGIGGNVGGVGGGAVGGTNGSSGNAGDAAVTGSLSDDSGVDGNNTGARRSDGDNFDNGNNGVQGGRNN